MARPRISDEQRRENARIRQAKHRARKSQARRERPLIADATDGLIQGDFAAYAREEYQQSTIEENLHAAGIVFEGDWLNEDHTGVYPEDDEWEMINNAPLNSLNRITLAIGAALDAAKELARVMNKFKTQEVISRISEAEERSAPKNEIDRLYRIKARLTKAVQVRLPVYYVQGD